MIFKTCNICRTLRNLYIHQIKRVSQAEYCYPSKYFLTFYKKKQMFGVASLTICCRVCKIMYAHPKFLFENKKELSKKIPLVSASISRLTIGAYIILKKWMQQRVFNLTPLLFIRQILTNMISIPTCDGMNATPKAIISKYLHHQ